MTSQSKQDNGRGLFSFPVIKNNLASPGDELASRTVGQESKALVADSLSTGAVPAAGSAHPMIPAVAPPYPPPTAR